MSFFFKENYTNNVLQKIKKKYNLPQKFILNVGTIEERKNLLNLVKSIKNIEITLIVVGKKTKYYNEILTYIQKNNLEKKVVFLKNVAMKELAGLYKMAEIFVYPSLFEGFGIPIVEALYSGTPVITSKGSCFSEAGGTHSVYVNSENVKELSQQINYLLENSKIRFSMAENGKKFVQKFDDEMIANSYYKCYKKLI